MMLKINNLSCGYNSKTILHNLNLEVNPGEFVGIIGPNGSGKTTFLRAITGIIPITKGEVLVEGKNIADFNVKDLAKKIALASQGFKTQHMTVEEFMLLGRIPYFKPFQFLETKKDMEILYNIMKLTDTLKLKGHFIEEISGGEQQLALIGRALVQKPKLLLLDEPTTHLDITHQISILDLVKRLNRKLNLTVIIVLHDLNLASQYCNRLALFNKGKIRKMGRPEEVLSYQIIEEVYNTPVVVGKNPVTKKPYVFMVSEEEKK